MSELIRKSVQRLDGYVPGEQPKGQGIIKLNTNENPYPPSPRIAEALVGLDATELDRYPDPVSLQLRERIAALHHCDVSQVFVGNGSDEILALCTRAFVENDGTIGYFDPSYSLYPVLAAIRDVATRPVALASDFGWHMPDEYSCSLFFLTNPNAPTGILYAKQDVRRFCSSMPGVVVLDEAYVDFSKDHCMDLALELPNVLVSRTLSKSYSLAALRLGYAVGSAPLIDAMFKIKDSYNLNRISQVVADAALSDVAHMRSNVEKICATRARLSSVLKELDFDLSPSETNFVWASPGGMPAAEMFTRLREQNVLVRYFPGARTGAHLRITVGTDEEIDALLSALRAILAS